MKYFYMRVSTLDQTTDNQQVELEKKYGKADQVFIDHGVSGTKKAIDRPAFKQMLSQLEPGDSVHVVGVDRIGRNTIDILSTVELLIAAGVNVVSSREGVDFSTTIGKMVLGVLASCAELERNLISDRTKAGLERAKSEGRVGGKRTTETGKIARQMLLDGATVADVIADTGMSKAMVYRIKAELSKEAA